jgi:hypothetical protein
MAGCHRITLDLELRPTLSVITVGIAYPCRFPLTLSPVHIAQRPSQSAVFNLQSGKLSEAVTVHNNEGGDIFVSLPQVSACCLQLSTQQITLVLQHLYAARHAKFEPTVIDQIICHQAHTIYTGYAYSTD